MSGVWVFRNGAMTRLTTTSENTESSGGQPSEAAPVSGGKSKVLLHTPSGQAVASYALLEAKLTALEWERYYEDPALLQFHKRGSLDLISLPHDFANFSSIHMYDITIKNRDSFRVVDADA